MTVLISIIVAVHNCKPYLEECLVGLENQSPFVLSHGPGSVEVSVYDDASSDGSFEYCREHWVPRLEKLGYKVILTRSEKLFPARGAAHARNRAIAQSSGTYLCIQDADDVSCPERLSLLWDAAQKHPDSTLFGSRFSRIPEGSTQRYTDWCNSLTPCRLKLEQYREVTLIQPTWFFSRKLFNLLGGYQEVENHETLNGDELNESEIRKLFESKRQQKKRQRLESKKRKLEVQGSGIVEKSDSDQIQQVHVSNIPSTTNAILVCGKEMAAGESTHIQSSNIKFRQGFAPDQSNAVDTQEPTQAENSTETDKVKQFNDTELIQQVNHTETSMQAGTSNTKTKSINDNQTAATTETPHKQTENKIEQTTHQASDHKDEVALAEDLRLFHRLLDLPNANLVQIPRSLVVYRHRGGSLCSQTPRKLLMKIRVRAFERRVLKLPSWKTFSIWGAGRDGKAFYKELGDSFKLRVKVFADIDEKKIQRGHFCALRRTQIPVVHFTDLSPPFVVCVAMNRTEGELEGNVQRLGLVEGKDYYHFV